MGITERRERERNHRINTILDAAEKVFAEKGLKNATIDDIAEAAELSKGTIYLYFKCKELIFVGIDMRGTIKLQEYFKKAVENKPNGISRVKAIGKAYYQFSVDYPNYFHTMSNFEKFTKEEIEGVQNEPIMQQAHKAGAAVMTILAGAIQSGIDDGSIRPDLDPMNTAFSLWAMSNGFIMMHNYRGEHIKLTNGVSPDFLLNDMEEFVSRTLKP